MTEGEAVSREAQRDETTANPPVWNAAGDHTVAAAFAALHTTLRRLARRALMAERTDHTLETAGLISEAFFRMLERRRVEWQSREHFISMVAQMMRRVLVDHARSRNTAKRGRGVFLRPLGEAELIPDDSIDGLVAIHEALEALAAVDRKSSEIVELRFFAGMTHEEIAEHLGLSLPTIERRWRLARAWLYRYLKGTVA